MKPNQQFLDAPAHFGFVRFVNKFIGTTYFHLLIFFLFILNCERLQTAVDQLRPESAFSELKLYCVI